MKEIIARCGFICNRCQAYRENVKNDADRQRVSKSWRKFYGLQLAADQIYCDGCLKPDSENPRRITQDCPFRKCTQQKGIPNCAYCHDYPCERLEKQMSGCESVELEWRGKYSAVEYRDFFSPYGARKTLGRIRKSVKKN